MKLQMGVEASRPRLAGVTPGEGAWRPRKVRIHFVTRSKKG